MHKSHGFIPAYTNIPGFGAEMIFREVCGNNVCRSESYSNLVYEFENNHAIEMPSLYTKLTYNLFSNTPALEPERLGQYERLLATPSCSHARVRICKLNLLEEILYSHILYGYHKEMTVGKTVNKLRFPMSNMSLAHSWYPRVFGNDFLIFSVLVLFWSLHLNFS